MPSASFSWPRASKSGRAAERELLFVNKCVWSTTSYFIRTCKYGLEKLEGTYCKGRKPQGGTDSREKHREFLSESNL